MADLPREDRADERLSILPLHVHRVLLLIIAVVLTGMDLSRLTGLWPCDIACQGGAHYQTLFGISVIWPAMLAHALLMCLAWYDVRRGRATLWTVQVVYVLSGVSIFFLIIADTLHLECLYCGAVHWLTLLAFILVVPYTRRVSAWLPVFGWLVMNALFHHTPVADVVTPGETPPTIDVQQTAAANRGRMYGDSAAPRTLEVVIDLTCRHCAEQYRPLMEALKPAIAAKRVRVVVRHLVRPSQSASTPAAELALAAAVLGEHAAAMEVLLGSNQDAGVAGLQARLGEVIDPVKLDAVFSAQRNALGALLTDDQQRITLLGVGPRTPSAVLLEDGKVTKRWSGDLPVTAILASLDGAL
jgi:protein-disulfide isomerase